MQFIMQNLESKQHFWEWEQKMQGLEKIKCTVSFQVRVKSTTSNVKNAQKLLQCLIYLMKTEVTNELLMT